MGRIAFRFGVYGLLGCAVAAAAAFGVPRPVSYVVISLIGSLS